MLALFLFTIVWWSNTFTNTLQDIEESVWPGDHRGEFVQKSVGVQPVQSDGVQPKRSSSSPSDGVLFIHSWSSSSSSPERSQVGSIHPRGELCSSKGRSDHGYRQVKTSFHEKKMQVFQEEESPQMVYEASEGGVETSAKRKKANPLTF